PVVAGCGDGQAAALGAGVTEADEGYLNMGTAVVAGVHSSQYRWSQVYRTDVAGIPGSYVLEVVQNSGAHLAQWFRTALGDPALQGAPDPELEQAAAQVRPGADGLLTLPYWNAVQSPHWDPLARGAMVGFTGSHSRPAMYRSLLEGICLETGRNLAALDAETGTPMRKLRIMGGGQRSQLWCRIMAACVARPLERCVSEEISALGAAVMAASAVVERSVPEMSRQMAEPGDTIEPQPELVEEYASIADVQGELYHALSRVFPRLEALRQ
ncbi:FGGY-family carbohydrate kinase, partial [uncultured Tessaracoccus sp.]|uniref:FGGY-family carbohydrate kinase n=1 Tax=uncultured Tessaracoccus sp. TaxID=905023 RepID=UPI0026121125